MLIIDTEHVDASVLEKHEERNYTACFMFPSRFTDLPSISAEFRLTALVAQMLGDKHEIALFRKTLNLTSSTSSTKIFRLKSIHPLAEETSMYV